MLTADHMHVILDCLGAGALPNMAAQHAADYDDDPDDPKATPEGWERLRAEAVEEIGKRLSTL